MTGPRVALAIFLAAGLLAPPLAAEAQPAPPAKVARIGCLIGGSARDPMPSADAFRQGLRDLGYVESRHYTIEFRYADGRIDRFPDLAAELVRLPVDIIVAPGTAAAVAARKATATLPVVLVLAANPALYGFREHPEAGGLMSYGPDLNDLHRRAAGYVDRILRGGTPASLPVERPSKFDLVVNRKTATQLGLAIPPSVLARADQIVE